MKKFIFLLIAWSNFLIASTNTASKTETSNQVKKDVADSIYDSRIPEDNLLCGGFFLVGPKKEYTKYYIKWWQSKTAVDFNPSFKMDEGQYSVFLERLAKYQEDRSLTLGSYIWFIVSEDTAEVVGTVGLNDVDSHNKTALICYTISEKHQRHGIATKALYLLLYKAFEVLGLEKVGATITPDNKASLKLIKKYRFKEEGVMRGQVVVANNIRKDFKLFGLLRSEWEEVKKSIQTKKKNFCSK